MIIIVFHRHQPFGLRHRLNIRRRPYCPSMSSKVLKLQHLLNAYCHGRAPGWIGSPAMLLPCCLMQTAMSYCFAAQHLLLNPACKHFPICRSTCYLKHRFRQMDELKLLTRLLDGLRLLFLSKDGLKLKRLLCSLLNPDHDSHLWLWHLSGYYKHYCFCHYLY